MRVRSSSDGLAGEYKTVMLAEQELWDSNGGSVHCVRGTPRHDSPAWDHEAAGTCH